MAVFRNIYNVSPLVADQYIKAGWSTVVIHEKHSDGAQKWLGGEDVEGEFDYQKLTLSQIWFWISDPDVAFEFKLRFG